MSMNEEIKALLIEQGEAIEEFKKKYGERLDEIEKRLGRFGLGGGPAAPSKGDRPAEIKALREFLRTGSDAELKAMSVGVDPDGGYLVVPTLSDTMTRTIFESSPVRRVARVVEIGSDAFEEPIDKDEAEASWVAETQSRTATDAPQLGMLRIPVEEIYAMPEVTQKLIDDSRIDVVDWLSAKIGDRFARTESTAFVTGNGVGKPRGFTTYPTAATADSSRAWGTFQHVATGTSGGFGTDPNGADKLLELVYSLKAGYRANATWAMNRATAGAVRKLKADGKYLWQDSFAAGQPPMLLGYPVVEMEDMPTYTTADSLAIAFGDFRRAYTVVDRIGTRFLLDPFTNKPYVRVYAYKRVGGDVADFHALKFLKFSAA